MIEKANLDLVGPDNLRYLLDVAKNVQDEANAVGLGRLPASPNSSSQTIGFDRMVTSPAIRSVSRRLFMDGHYTQAVEDAFKRLNNEVKVKSGLFELDGDPLMRRAFSANSPVLQFNDLKTISQKDEQRGYMDLYAGAMAAIRNPRAHEHDLEDDPQIALELLTLANHLMTKLESARRMDGTRTLDG